MSLQTLNDFIKGTFKSNPSGSQGSFDIDNELDIDLEALRMDASGNVAATTKIKRKDKKSVDARLGDVFVVRSQATQAWIRSISVDPGDLGRKLSIESSDLLALDEPNFKTPLVTGRVPQGPTLVMVGVGKTNGRTVTESLFWKQTGSFLVPANSTTTETITDTSGTTLTESQERTLSTEIGVSFTTDADLFFASVSTTLSATFTSSTSFTRSFAVTKSSSTMVTTPFTNTTSDNVVMFRYQLVQRVSVFKDGDLKSTLENALPVFELDSVKQ